MKNLLKSIVQFIIILIPFVTLLAQQTLIYETSEMMSGKVVGTSKLWKNEDGSYQNFYQINDRGRGDSIVSTYTQDNNGFLTKLLIQGVDYFKKSVEETFSLKNGIAKWTNDSENEELKVNKDAFYISLKNGGGNFIEALLKNNNQINLIPSGTARLEIIKQHTIIKEGVSHKLSLYAIYGLGFTPSYGWLDDNNIYFAVLDSWYSSIRKGYESYVQELLDIQTNISDKFYNKIAQNNIEVPTTLLIDNVLLFDSKKAKTIPNSWVLVENGRIVKVSKGKLPNSPNARKIDGKGMMLLPGMIDMHVHLSDNLSALQYLINGVTSVRDMGGPFAVLEYRDKILRGGIVGPTIELTAGLVDGKGEFAGPTPALADNVQGAVSWVDTFYNKGYRQIKIYSSIKPEWVPAIVKRAKQLGMRVSGHIPAFMTAEKAIKLGYNEIQHMNMIFLNFYGDTIDTRSPLRFRLPAQKAANFDFNGDKCKAFIKLLKNRNITVDPTINIFESMFTSRAGKLDVANAAIIDRLPLDMQRYFKAGGGGLPVPQGYDSIYIQSFQSFLKMLKLFYDNKVSIVAGTDAWAGFSFHRELELYSQAGIPNTAVLQIATYRAAEILNKLADIGSIEKGKRANMILIDGDPTKDISDIRKVASVIKDGKIYNLSEILKSISIKNYDFKN